jgi:hypothetical protein
VCFQARKLASLASTEAVAPAASDGPPCSRACASRRYLEEQGKGWSEAKEGQGLCKRTKHKADMNAEGKRRVLRGPGRKGHKRHL